MTKQTNNKKAVYISINLDEFAALETLGFRERWAYLALKRIANFKTGAVGAFGKQKLTFTVIADLIKPPPGIQGRGEGKIDDTQARDFLLRMGEVGLVSEISRRPNGGLRFTLPMSPIDRPKAGKKANIFPEEAVPVIVDEAKLSGHPEVSPSSQSVLNSQEIKINTEEAAGPSCDGAASVRASGATPCRAEGAAASRENPPTAADASAPLTAQQIHDTLEDCWTFDKIDTPEAWELYESWAKSKITLDDLHAAMIGVEETDDCPDPTPAHLAPRLWPMIVDRKFGQLSA